MNGYARFDSFKSQGTFRPRGPYGLKWEFGFLSAKRTTRGCPLDYSVKHYPLKTLNGRLGVVLGQPKGIGSLKHLG